MSKKKSVVTTLLTAILLCVTVLFSTGCSNISEGTSNGVTCITETNKTYEGDILSLTVTEFRVDSKKAFFTGKVTETAVYVVEVFNSSDEEVTLTEGNVSAYVDDTLYDMENVKFSGLGKILPDKKAVVEIKMTLPEDATSAEIAVRESLDENKGGYVTFKFDVTPAETIAPLDTSVDGNADPDDRDFKDELGDKVSEFADKAGNKISEYADKAGELVSEVGDYIDEHDGFVTDVKDYIDGVISDIKDKG